MIDDRSRPAAVETLRPTHSAATLRLRFVGFGSSHGDDRVGWTVADRLATVLSDPQVVRHAASPADLFDVLDDCDRLLLCDACRSGDRPGSATARAWPLPDALSLRSTGTHAFGLIDALRMAEALGRLPREVILWTIEGRDFGPGSPLSVTGAAAANEVADRLLRDEFGIVAGGPTQ